MAECESGRSRELGGQSSIQEVDAFLGLLLGPVTLGSQLVEVGSPTQQTCIREDHALAGKQDWGLLVKSVMVGSPAKVLHHGLVQQSAPPLSKPSQLTCMHEEEELTQR